MKLEEALELARTVDRRGGYLGDAEAAKVMLAEIERLRAENERLTESCAELSQAAGPTKTLVLRNKNAEIAKLRAENALLGEQLQQSAAGYMALAEKAAAATKRDPLVQEVIRAYRENQEASDLSDDVHAIVEAARKLAEWKP